MNITFLIGNGFDLNIGLATKYNDFFEHYRIDNQNDSKEVKELKASINKYFDNDDYDNLDGINWSNAELAFGQFTAHFVNDDHGDQAISNCYSDLCQALADYLTEEEKKFNSSAIKKDKSLMQKIWSGLIDITKGLRPVDRDNINNFISSQGGGFSINIIDFNYTKVIDKITASLTQEGIPGNRRFNNNNYNNRINPIIHIHGTTTHGMAFGVNDESQLEKNIFTDEEPERKWQLIKPLFNENMGENVDGIAWNAIKSAQIIYVYGMSIGATDKIWWERIIEHLSNNIQTLLIVHQYSCPTIKLSPAQYVREQRLFRKKLLNFGESLDQSQEKSIEERIFLTGGNIFDCLTDYVKNEDKLDA